MHVHLPKPLHGWRAFAGEVGIIVVGVLIALAAEQLVETLRWQSAARDFRAAVDHEAALNIGAFEFNQLQQKCTRRRLDEAMAGNWPGTRDLGSALGIKPALPPETAAIGSHTPSLHDALPISTGA